MKIQLSVVESPIYKKFILMGIRVSKSTLLGGCLWKAWIILSSSCKAEGVYLVVWSYLARGSMGSLRAISLEISLQQYMLLEKSTIPQMGGVP